MDHNNRGVSLSFFRFHAGLDGLETMHMHDFIDIAGCKSYCQQTLISTYSIPEIFDLIFAVDYYSLKIGRASVAKLDINPAVLAVRIEMSVDQLSELLDNMEK